MKSSRAFIYSPASAHICAGAGRHIGDLIKSPRCSAEYWHLAPSLGWENCFLPKFCCYLSCCYVCLPRHLPDTERVTNYPSEPDFEPDLLEIKIIGSSSNSLILRPGLLQFVHFCILSHPFSHPFSFILFIVPFK